MIREARSGHDERPVLGLAVGRLWTDLVIPVTATLKVICDHVPDLQPWGRWLGA